MAKKTLGSKGGMNALPALANLVHSGNFNLHNKVKFVGNGIDGIEQGLDKLMKGVSGAKDVANVQLRSMRSDFS